MYSKVKVTLGIVAGALGFAGLAVGLGAMASSDNADYCEKIGLKSGFIEGCKVDKELVYDKIVILAGNTANSPSPMLSDKHKEILHNSLYSDGDMKIELYSAASKTSRIKFQSKIKIGESDSPKTLAEKYSKIEAEIDQALSSSPKVKGANYYDSIIKLGKGLSGDYKRGDRVLLIVMGSGLSDSGTIDFSAEENSEILKKDTDAIVSAVNEANKINEEALTGVNIIWSYLGQTVAPQQELREEQKNSLENMYEALVSEMDAESFELDDVPNESDESVKTEYEVKPFMTEYKSLWGNRSFTEDEIGFQPKSAELLNAQKTSSLLDDLVSELNNNKSESVYITSYHARLCNGEDETVNEELLNQRSNKIKSLLEDRGVTNKIITNSGGFGSEIQGKCETKASDRRVEISVR